MRADELQIRIALGLPRSATTSQVLERIREMRDGRTLAEAQLQAVLAAPRRDPILAIDDAVQELAERLEAGERLSLRDALTLA